MLSKPSAGGFGSNTLRAVDTVTRIACKGQQIRDLRRLNSKFFDYIFIIKKELDMAKKNADKRILDELEISKAIQEMENGERTLYL